MSTHNIHFLWGWGEAILMSTHNIFFMENIRCGYSLESPQKGDSNEYTQHMFLWRKQNYPLIVTKNLPL